MGEEQRKHERFCGTSDTFVALIRPDMPIIVGKIMDISLGGLGMQYVALEDLTWSSPRGHSHVEIFGPSQIRMERIESNVVYDVPLPDQAWNNFSVRRCGIEFSHAGYSPIELQDYIATHFSTSESLAG